MNDQFYREHRRRYLKMAARRAEDAEAFSRQYFAQGVLASLCALIIACVGIFLAATEDWSCAFLLAFTLPPITVAYSSFREVPRCRQRHLLERERILDYLREKEQEWES